MTDDYDSDSAPDSERLPGDLKFMPYLGQTGLSGGWLDCLTEISQYKIPFCIAMTYPLAQRNRHMANIFLLDRLNMVPDLFYS